MEFPQAQHTERNTNIAVVRLHQTSVIQTVQETAEVPQRLQLDRVLDRAVGIQRQTTDDPIFRSGRWLMTKMVTQTTRRVSDAEVINGDADDTKGMVAHDTQMRYSPSFFPDSTQVCVEMDVNRPKEKGQPVMGQISKQLLKRRVKPQNVSARALGHKLSRHRALRRQAQWWSNQDLSDVCGEDANDEEHKNQRGLLASVMESRLLPSPALNRIQCSRHVQGVVSESSGKVPNIVEKEKAKTAAESTASENATSESTSRKTDDSGGTSASL